MAASDRATFCQSSCFAMAGVYSLPSANAREALGVLKTEGGLYMQIALCSFTALRDCWEWGEQQGRACCWGGCSGLCHLNVVSVLSRSPGHRLPYIN